MLSCETAVTKIYLATTGQLLLHVMCLLIEELCSAFPSSQMPQLLNICNMYEAYKLCLKKAGPLRLIW